MNEKLYHTQYDVNEKPRIKKFFEKYKLLLFSTVLFLFVAWFGIVFYLEKKESKKILLSDNYHDAEIYLQNNEKDEAKKILEKIVFENDPTYSALSLFLLIDENLLNEENEMSRMFNHILNNNSYEKEIKNLIILKKALLESRFVSEVELLKTIDPIIKRETVWRPQALLLIGDYFFYKNEKLKAKQFYMQILELKNLNRAIIDYTRLQLSTITND